MTVIMISNRRLGQQLVFLLFSISNFSFLTANFNVNLDSTGQSVSFYPASMMIAHNPRPIMFYSETKLVNVAMTLKPTAVTPSQIFQTNCTDLPQLTSFFTKVLKSVQSVRRVSRRISSLSGYSHLLECESFLRRLLMYELQIPGKMLCPSRIFKPSVLECKQWALKACSGFQTDEKKWLENNTKPRRRKRSSWFCHAGLLGLFRFLYESTGGKCEPNHVENLKTTLKAMSKALTITQNLVHTVNGKTVYLARATETLNTKLNKFSFDLKQIDATLSTWSKTLRGFVKTNHCHFNLLMEFLSRYSFEVNSAFHSLLRLTEIHDTLAQLSRLEQKSMIGFSDLPHYVTTAISNSLVIDSDMKFTLNALNDGLSVLLHPSVDIEHNGKHLDINILVTVPQITNFNSFCSLEYLTPIKINISNTCYTGPVRQKNLVLITCSESKQLTTVETLQKCHTENNQVLCPINILNTVTNLSWLGFRWNSRGVQLPFSRNHVPTSTCGGLHPLYHLGSRYYLATTTMDLETNTGTLAISPLQILQFPCNTSFIGMATGLTTCPQTMEIHVPIYSRDTVKFVSWRPDSADDTLLNLHYKTLNIPPATQLNKSVLQSLDETYDTLDTELSTQIRAVNQQIDSIKATSNTTFIQILTFIALCLGIVNLLAFLVFCYCYHKRQSLRKHSCRHCNRTLLITSDNRKQQITSSISSSSKTIETTKPLLDCKETLELSEIQTKVTPESNC